jgi:hypothetical protein
MLKEIFDKRDGGGMDRIHLGQDRDQWGALVDTVMKLRESLE